ncbi:hypothetical protein ABZP36_018517 [Zizania latifolia]
MDKVQISKLPLEGAARRRRERRQQLGGKRGQHAAGGGHADHHAHLPAGHQHTSTATTGRSRRTSTSPAIPSCATFTGPAGAVYTGIYFVFTGASSSWVGFRVPYSTLVLTFIVSQPRRHLSLDILVWATVIAFLWLAISLRPDHRTSIVQALCCGHPPQLNKRHHRRVLLHRY